VPACHDAVQSSEADPTNWKAYWRQSIALNAMTKKQFRTKQSIEALEKCLSCQTLPEDKRPQIQEQLAKTKGILQRQIDEVIRLFRIFRLVIYLFFFFKDAYA
jgi:hypothetical protein